MAKNLAELNVTELDFDLIKQNLITYFKADPTFSDYEFEGSALNILIDVLAYNTHMNAVMANMSANEMFIDSAQLRASVISIAKALAYTPRSVRTSKAEISLTFNNVAGAPAYITIPAGTRFSSNSKFIFSTKDQYFAYPTEEIGKYVCPKLEIYEGIMNDFTYIVNYNDPNQRFIIPSVNADTTTLSVRTLSGASVTAYSLNQNITLLDPSSLVYFLHENPSGYFEVSFGDNILGKRPINGCKVILSYIVSEGRENAINSSIFTPYQSISGYAGYKITTLIPAYGAAEKEPKEEVAARAPRMYKAQHRAVITEDYENFMLQEFPFIESLSVWGGEHNDPPVYGKVFFSMKPSHTEYLSANLKAKIKDELIKKFNVVTVIPEIIDPTYLYILTTTTIKFNKSKTVLTETGIQSKVREEILKYSSSYLQKFNATFYFSKLLGLLDDIDSSISGSLMDLKLMAKISPRLGVEEQFVINLSNPIVPGSVFSSYYNSGTTGSTAKQGIYDDGEGNLLTKDALFNQVVFSQIGTVDYDKGKISFSILPYSVPTDTFDIRIYATPVSENIISENNQIIMMDDTAAKQDFNRKQGIIVQVSAINLDYK
jgi:hypothetical protein